MRISIKRTLEVRAVERMLDEKVENGLVQTMLSDKNSVDSGIEGTTDR